MTGVHPLRVDAEQLRDLLDHDREEQGLEIGAALGAVLDRPPEQHQPGRGGPAAADQRGQRHLVALPVVRELRCVLDGVLHQAELVLPPQVDAGHDAQRQVVEPLSSGRQLGVAGLPRQHAGAAHPSPAPVTAAGGPGGAVLHVVDTSRPTGAARLDEAASTRGYGRGVSPSRRCSRTACDRPAVTTLTYVYADQTAVLGPLATYAEPHAYDLCDRHAERLSAPRGWEVLRLVSDLSPRGPSDDDLLALANAVREAARPVPAAAEPPGAEYGSRETLRRGHLRVLTHDEAPGS